MTSTMPSLSGEGGTQPLSVAGLPRTQLWRIVLPYAVFGVIASEGEIIKAAPIGSWMVGKPVGEIIRWVGGKRGYIEPVF